LKWQQAFQASAQALQIGNSVFANLLAAVNSA
jgi:flagellar hook-associated protein FlgK